jgi:hypothetical protein
MTRRILAILIQFNDIIEVHGGSFLCLEPVYFYCHQIRSSRVLHNYFVKSQSTINSYGCEYIMVQSMSLVLVCDWFEHWYFYWIRTPDSIINTWSIYLYFFWFNRLYEQQSHGNGCSVFLLLLLYHLSPYRLLDRIHTPISYEVGYSLGFIYFFYSLTTI